MKVFPLFYLPLRWLTVLFLMAPTLTLAGDTPWEPLGPTAATIFSLARDPASPSVVYAGAHFGGAYRSGDGGLHWTPVEGPFASNTIFCIAIDPGNNSHVYLGTFDNGIFHSADNGITWSAINNGLTSLNITSIVVGPANGNHLIAATTAGVHVSNDRGQTWQPASSGLSVVATKALVYDNADPSRLYAGTSGLGVWLSTNGGIDWTPLGTATANRTITALVMDPNALGELYASTSDAIFLLPAGSSSWQELTYDLPGTLINQAMPRPLDSGLFAATDDGIYALDSAADTSWRQWNPLPTALILPDPSGNWLHLAGKFGQLLLTPDDGTTFIDVANGIQNRFVGTLETISIGSTTILYAGSDEGLEFTTEAYTDGIRQFWIPTTAFSGTIFDIESTTALPGTLYLGTERDGVWKSSDYGNTWSRKSRGMVPTLTFDIAQANAGDGTIYAGTSSGVYISRNDGISWTPNDHTATPRQVLSVAVDPVRTGVAWYGTTDGRIFRTLDGGKSFSEVWRSPDGAGILQIEAAPYFNIYAVSTTGDLYVSTDVGVTFFKRASEVPDKVLSVAVDWERPWNVWIGTQFGGVWKSESNAINWFQASNGIDIPIIFSLNVDPQNSARLYAGAKGAIYRSDDGGSNWNLLGSGLPDQFISHVGIDPVNGNLLYASAENSGIYLSEDGGNVWQPLNMGAAMPGRSPLLVTDKSALLSATPGLGIVRSGNGGLNWSQSSDGMTLFVRSIAIDSSNPQIVYAGSLDSGIFKSIDGGENWLPIGLEDRNIFNIVISPADSNVLYVGSSLGIERSLDGGQTWHSLANRDSFIFDVISDPANPLRLFAAGVAGRVFVSDNGGISWRQAGSNMPGENVLSLHLDAASGDLYAGTERQGVYRLPAGGNRWLKTALNILTSTKVTALTMHAGNLLAATSGEGLFISRDQGASWESSPLVNSQVFNLAVDSFTDGRLFAITLSSDGTGAGLSRSDDGGLSWNNTSFPEANAFALALSPHTQGRLFVAGYDRLYRSNDSGTSWQPIDAGLGGARIRALWADPATQGKLLAGADNGQIFSSTDAGATWQSTAASTGNGSISAFATGPAPAGVYVASLGNGVSRSDNSGMDWDQGAALGIYNISVLFLAIDPINPSTLYASTGGKGVLKSTDAGETWRPANTGLDASLLLSLHIDRSNSQVLFTGSTESGIYISEDGAQSWRQWNLGLINRTVTSITSDPLDPGRVYVGTEGGGIYRNRWTPATQ